MSAGESLLGKLRYKGLFLQLLASQGVANLGDSFRFIALTMLLLKLTGSGMTTSLGLLFSILPSLVLSPMAGTIGDILPSRYLLSMLDMIRGIIIILFPLCKNAREAFIIIIALSLLDTVYGPARRKIIVLLAGKDGILNANSLLTGFSGAVYLIGPLMAGFITDEYGPEPGFAIAGAASVISSLLILTIKMPSKNDGNNMKKPDTGLFGEMVKGFDYVKKNRNLEILTLICMLVALCSVSVNMAFYPFSFDVLALGAKEWSLMISIYYGTNLLAAFLLLVPLRRIQEKPWFTVFICLGATAIIWFLYSISKDFVTVLVLQFTEGTILAVCGIVLTTLLQENTKNIYMARVAGVNDIIASIGKIAGMAGTYLLMRIDSYKSVFIANSFILLVFAIACLTFLVKGIKAHSL